MSKAVLISINPKWCELIASGKKTVEIRKTKPKLETPFKCYIYESSGNQRVGNENFNVYLKGKGRKKVIGEFVCNEITEFYPTMDLKQLTSIHFQMCEKSCVDMEDLYNYANNKILYGYHITDLVIYDEPKELREFRTPCKYRNDDGSCQYKKVDCECVKFDFNPDYSVNFAECCDFMTRPPQSWCYVESEVE